MSNSKSHTKDSERGVAASISLCPVLRKRAQMRGVIFMGVELVFWLSSVAYAFLSSLSYSVLLFPRFLSAYFQHGHHDDEEDDGSVVFYEGKVFHGREKPVRHCFSLAVRYALLDLDRLPPSLAPCILRRHMTADEARRITGTSGRVLLLTIPTSVGYDYDPVSIYYCYDSRSDGPQLKRCIVEVTNTPWGERVTFAFSPGSDFVVKTLHVSPFNDMHGNWSLHTNNPGENLFLKIAVHHPTLGDFFSGTLQAKRVKVSAFWRHNPDMFFWLMPQKAAIWTYWQAFNLWWKGVPFVEHPRYSNPNFVQETIEKNTDKKFMDCPENKVKEDNQDDSLSTGTDQSGQMNAESRYFAWKNAEWPWSYDF